MYHHVRPVVPVQNFVPMWESVDLNMSVTHDNSAMSGQQQQWNDLHLFKDQPLKWFVEFTSLKKDYLDLNTVDNK